MHEVSRSLAACEGAILVWMPQGIEAQNISKRILSTDNDLELLPVVIKLIYLQLNLKRAKQELEDVIGLNQDDVVLASAKVKYWY